MARTKLAGNTKTAKQRKKGWSCGFTCISKGKECKSVLPDQAKNYADWMAKQAGGAIVKVGRGGLESQAKPADVAKPKSATPKTKVDEIDDRYAKPNPTREDVDNWIKEQVAHQATAEQLALHGNAAMALGYLNIQKAADAPEYIKAVKNKESWAQAMVIREHGTHSSRDSWKPEDFMMHKSDRAKLEKKLNHPKTSDAQKAKIRKDLKESDDSSQAVADRMNATRDEVLNHPEKRLEAARKQFDEIAKNYEAPAKKLLQDLDKGDPQAIAKLSENAVSELPAYLKMRKQLGRTPDSDSAAYRRVVKEHLQHVATGTPEKLLKVDGEVTPTSVKAAYKLAAKKAHPDSGGSKEAFKQVNDAYQALKQRLNFSDGDDATIVSLNEYAIGLQIFDFAEIEIEILPKGTHTSSNGFKLPVSDRDLDDLVNSYNPASFQAPLIISHDTKGLPDAALIHSEFAFGVPKALKRVGDRVKAVFDKVAPEFEQWVKDRKLLSVSPSFYLPSSPSNPTPGKLALRHIAALGRSAPAIKGMQTLQHAFNFNDSEEGTVSFNFDATRNTVEFGGDLDDRLVAQTFQSLRDWLISEHGLEVADRVIPSYTVGMLLESAAAQNEPDLPTYQAMTTEQEIDFSERERQLAEREALLLKKELVSFCECELKGKLTPAIASQDELLNFMAFLNTQTELDFSEEKTESPLEWFKGLLTRLPVQVEFSEVAQGAMSSAPSQQARTADFNAEEVEADRQIRAYMSQNKVEYAEAMTALGILY